MKHLYKIFLVICIHAVSVACESKQPETTNKKLKLTVGGYDYDRVTAIMNGSASIENTEVEFEMSNIYELNKLVFGPDKKFEISEVGLIPYITKYINEDFREYTLIPVFISRVFRHRNIFVHADSGIDTPEDLIDKKVGTPGYGMSANTWIRGFLLDEHGIKADDFEWIESNKSSDGGQLNDGFANYYFDKDFPISKGPEGVDESELLLSGQCDALITAITPKAFLEGNPKIKRLYDDVKSAELAYYQKTKMFPIMHVIAIRNDVIKDNPWLPKAVFDMYCNAKQRAYDNLETTTSLKVSLPWVTQEFEETRALMGNNYWKYGIEANRKELEAIMRYVYEQGLAKQQVSFEELFEPSTLKLKDKY